MENVVEWNQEGEIQQGTKYKAVSGWQVLLECCLIPKAEVKDPYHFHSSLPILAPSRWQLLWVLVINIGLIIIAVTLLTADNWIGNMAIA